MASFRERIGHFLHTGMWKADTRRLSRWETVLRDQARLWFMIGQRFRGDRCFIRASSLAFTTAFAIVPVIVVVFWLFGGVESFRGYAPIFAERIVEYITIGIPAEDILIEGEPALTSPEGVEFPPRESMEANIRHFLETLATDAVGSRALNSVSLTLIILITVSLLSTIERSFNDIWGIKRGRSLFYKSNLYLGTIVMLVILAGASLGLRETQIMERLHALPYLGGIIFFLGSQILRLVAFTFLFVYMAYTKVSWRAGIAGGIFASILVQGIAWAGFLFNTRVVTWRSVYGPLAGVPVILFGLYIIWIIMLLGAELTYAVQNLRTYVQERRVGELDQASKESLALRIVLAIARAFARGAEPLTGKQISELFDIPPKLVNELTHRLVLGGILVETEDLEGKLVPRQDLMAMNVSKVARILRLGTTSSALAGPTGGESQLGELIFRAEETIGAAYGKVTFGDLLGSPEPSSQSQP